jgi:predicted amidohydrolase
MDPQTHTSWRAACSSRNVLVGPPSGSLMRSVAIENQAYVVGVNRVGEGGGLTYAGDSRIIDPMGEVLAQAPDGAEACIVADVEPSVVADTRARLPFLRDRRAL